MARPEAPAAVAAGALLIPGGPQVSRHRGNSASARLAEASLALSPSDGAAEATRSTFRYQHAHCIMRLLRNCYLAARL
jgi:hypothetical protein